MFSAFTLEEVDNIRSVVFIGKQDNEELLLNSTSRPLNQTRAFIRRFKRYLLDLQYSASQIVDMANHQYIAIIRSIRSKKSSFNSPSSIKSNNSISNTWISSSLVLTSVPLKFRSKFYHEFPTSTENSSKPSSDFSTLSTNSNLNYSSPSYNTLLKQNVIPYLPISTYRHPRALNSIDIPAGSLVAIFRSPSEVPVVSRILGARKINGYDYLLVSFFQKGVIPCYVPPQSIIPIVSASFENESPIRFSVDFIIEHIMKMAQHLIIDNSHEIQPHLSQDPTQKNLNDDMNKINNSENISNPNPFQDQVQNLIHLSTFNCALQLLLLSFLGNWEIPENKQKLMIEAIFSLSQIKYQSTRPSYERGKNLLKDIIQKITNNSSSSS